MARTAGSHSAVDARTTDRAVMIGPFARFRAHTYMYPLFLCRACGAAWPCGAARLALLNIYRDDPARLRVVLTGRLMIALAAQPKADSLTLATRFLGWLPPQT